MTREDRQRAKWNRKDNVWPRLVTGMAVLGAGVIFWLDHLGRVDAGDFLRWWPLLVIASGLAHLPEGRWVSATILTVIGIAFLPDLPFLPRLHISQLLGLWPLLISAGGVTLIAQALRPKAKDVLRRGRAFRSIAVMGGSGRTFSSPDFIGGDAVAVMGGCEIDLSQSTIVSEAVIDVLVFWGGVEIKVPRGWEVESHVLALLGAVDNRTIGAPAPNAPRLIVRGSAIMGGVELRHPKEDAV
jgi:hypothetical protein